jgi:hypothetical protein
MAKFVWDGARMVNKDTGEPMVSGDWVPAVPQVIPDMEGYCSPIDGTWIEGRRARRYDLERSNSIDAREFRPEPRKLKNERFIKKHGLQHLSER